MGGPRRRGIEAATAVEPTVDPAMRRRHDGGAVGEVFLADEVSFEHPVGSARRHRRDALRTRSEVAVAATIRKTTGDPVAGQDDIPVITVMSSLPAAG